MNVCCLKSWHVMCLEHSLHHNLPNFLNLNSKTNSLWTPSGKHFLITSDYNDSYYRQELIELELPDSLIKLLIMWVISINKYTLKNDFLNFYLKITINSFHVNILRKNNYLQKNFNKKSSTVHIFANLFNVRLNKRQLDSHICFIYVCQPLHRYIVGKERFFFEIAPKFNKWLFFKSKLQCGIWISSMTFS